MDKLKDVDIDSVAAMLGVTDKTIRTWVKELGCPSSKDGRSRTFYWPDVLAWYVDYAAAKKGGVAADFAPDEEMVDEKENLATAMLRKTRAEADLKQLILAERRSEVIGIDDARVRLERMLGNLRTNLMNMAPKLATRLAGERDPIAQEAVLREEMEALCRELATGKIVSGDDEESTGDGEEVQDINASAEVITDDDLNGVVVEFLLAHAAAEELASA